MRIIYLAAVAAIVPFFSFAQSAFDDVVNIVVTNNPELQSQRQLILAQKAEDSDANSLANPQFEMSRVWGRHGIGNKLQIDVSQEFEWPGVYSARKNAAKLGRSAAQLEVEANAFDLRTQTMELLTELVYVRKQLELVDLLLADMKQIGEATQKASENGEMTILDQKKLEFETYELDNQHASLKTRENQICTDLQALCPNAKLNLEGFDKYQIAKLLSADEYKNIIAQNDPTIGAQRMTAQQEEANAKVATRSRMPGFSVGYQHQAEMGDRFNGFTLGVELPFFQNRHARTAAIAKKEAAQMSASYALEQKYAEIDGNLADMAIWRSQIERYNTVFGDNQYLTLLSKAYNGGEINIIEYLGEVHYYHQATFQFLEAEYNYNQALTALNKYNF